MSRQTWTAAVSALVFVGLAVLLAVVPVPFVTWSPGGSQDTLGLLGSEPIIKIEGTDSFPTTGRLDLTTISVTRADSRLSLPEAVLGYWLPHRDSLPRDAVYPPWKTPQQVDSEDADLMATAQDDAVVAALRAAGQPVTEMPVVSSVTVGGPAHGHLLPGDLVVSVDGVSMAAPEAVGKQVRTHSVGERVTFVVVRNRLESTVAVTTSESASQQGEPVVGIEVGLGYRYQPRISFDFGQKIGGPSAGLVFALAIYDKITPGPLLNGSHIAGTGEITPNGDVGAIGGIQEKIAAAENSGASAFLVPAPNCGELVGVQTHMTLVKVDTLAEGISAVRTLGQPGGAARTPRC